MPFLGQRSPLDDVIKTAMGIVSWTSYPSIFANSAPATQQIYAIGVPYRQGQVVTNIGWYVQTAAVGVAPTGIFCGICSSTTMLMDSANLAASAAWTTTGLRTVALSSPLTIPSTGLYYHLFLKNGAFGTTDVQLCRETSVAGAMQINAAGAFLFATAGTAQTALPAVSAGVALSAGSAPLRFVTFST